MTINELIGALIGSGIITGYIGHYLTKKQYQSNVKKTDVETESAALDIKIKADSFKDKRIKDMHEENETLLKENKSLRELGEKLQEQLKIYLERVHQQDVLIKSLTARINLYETISKK